MSRHGTTQDAQIRASLIGYYASDPNKAATDPAVRQALQTIVER